VSSAYLARSLRKRLEARRAEIEQAILTRVYSVSDPIEAGDPEYVAGLRAAVGAAVELGISAIEPGVDQPTSIPVELFAQARYAARNGVSLDTVLRRYFAGYTLLGDFVVAEAEDGGSLKGPGLQRLLRVEANVFDRLVVAISDEYARELEMKMRSSRQRRVEQVRRLLAGELLDAGDLGYELHAWHLGLIGAGRDAEQVIRDLAGALDRRLLAVPMGAGTVWAWLGGRQRIDPIDLAPMIPSNGQAEASLAVGEPGHGLGGWRITHRQASAALPIVLAGGENVIHYANVCLLASIVQDDLLATSLRQMYLGPLAEDRDGGEAYRETLRAYFVAGRNGASAAAALGVSRQTVNARLHAIEERLGRPLTACAAEIEAALRLEEFDRRAPHLPGA
jgi:hypothetical protein